MKELNLYALYVNTRGPYAYTKSGNGVWCVCETSEKNARKALQEHFNKECLLGSVDRIKEILPNNPEGYYVIHSTSQLVLDTEILPRRKCMLATTYGSLLDKKYNQNVYKFSPKKSEKGMNLHKINKPSKEYRNISVPGAYKANDTLNCIEDCGDLKDIDGVTYNGNPLSSNNLNNLMEQITDDYER